MPMIFHEPHEPKFLHVTPEELQVVIARLEPTGLTQQPTDVAAVTMKLWHKEAVNNCYHIIQHHVH